MQSRKVNLPSLQIRSDIKPNSFNKEKRTVEVVFSTGAKGLRTPFFDEPYYEELSMDPSAVRLARLNNGAPVLNAHNSYSLDAVMGVVDSARLEGGLGIATLRFSEREDVAPMVRDIEAGIITKVSIGYRVNQYKDVTEGEQKYKTYRAVDWEPFEISMVPIAFDDAASVRSTNINQEKFECEIVSRSETTEGEPKMEEKETPKPIETPKAADPAPAPKENNEASKEAAASERARSTGILAAVRAAKLDAKFAEDLISKEITLDQARAQIIDELAKKTIAVDSRSHVEAGELDEIQTVRDGMEEAILHRGASEIMRGKVVSEKARPFMHMTLPRMAEECLVRRGIKTSGLSRWDLVTKSMQTRAGMHTVADFPSVLAAVVNKTLRQAYEQAPQSFRPFVRVTTAPDFKQVSRTQLDGAPALALVAEHGEFTYGTLGDTKEVYTLGTYGKIVAITRQVIVNDDLNAFTRIPMFYARAAAQLETNLVYGILTANANMNDGVALFASGHGNLGTTGAITNDSLGEMRKLLRLQKGLTSEDTLNLVAKYLIVPAAKETLANTFLTNITPNQASAVNQFSGGVLQLIVEPLLDASSSTTWYGAADPSSIDTIELAYLEGQQGLQTETEMGFDIDGVKVKARLDVAAKAIDWRGLFKNVGA